MKVSAQIRFIRQLNKLAEQADRLEIRLPNGGEVGGLLGSIATDLQMMWDVPEICIQAPKRKQK